MQSRQKCFVAQVLKINQSIQLFCFIPPTLANVLKKVVCVLNYIKANQLRSRILSHTEVRWLSKRKNLEFLCLYESWNHFVHRHRGSWFFVSKGWCLVAKSFVSERFFWQAQGSEFEFARSWRKLHHNQIHIQSVQKNMSLEELKVNKSNLSDSRSNPSKFQIKLKIELLNIEIKIFLETDNVRKWMDNQPIHGSKDKNHGVEEEKKSHWFKKRSCAKNFSLKTSC
jgi:hypothetical protein